MASESSIPAAPQSEVISISTTNNPARIGPYTDVVRTKRNSVPVGVPTPLPPRSGSITLGNIRSAYANDAGTEIANDGPFPETPPPPKAPNHWPIETDAHNILRSRDPYRNGGMIGQPFFG